MDNNSGAIQSNVDGDWRNNVKPEFRRTVVNRIADTLRRHIPFHAEMGSQQLERIAIEFEDKIYAESISINEYVRKISPKMLAIEPNKPLTNLVDMDLGLMDNNYSRAIDGDRRNNVQPKYRRRIVNKIADTLKRHLFYAKMGSQELERIAIEFENKIYAESTSKSDYLRKISSKMLTIESNKPLTSLVDMDLGLMDNNNSRAIQWNVDGDWRNNVQPESRRKIVNKIAYTLRRNVPFHAEEGSQELERIAIKFEDKIYAESISASEYLRKISSKLLTIELDKSLTSLANMDLEYKYLAEACGTRISGLSIHDPK